jgi:predicted RNA-binding protein Jag
MNALFGLAAAPKAANAAVNATNNALGTFTRPFGQFFQSAVEEGDSSASAASASAAHEATSLEARISRQLQELLTSLGAEPDEEAAIRFDETTGEINVDGHHSAPAIEAVLKNDGQLMADLQRLAKLQSEFDPSVSPTDWELQARVTESGGAQLRWR